jgi:signal transduction histidine kinase
VTKRFSSLTLEGTVLGFHVIGEDMTGEDKRQRSPERIQTDESLRDERDKVDDAIGTTFSALEELGNAVIEKARVRADAVLAAAREKEDRASERRTARESGLLARNRGRADAVLDRERSDADELIRAERASPHVHLSTLRHYTDEDLFEERSRGDDELATRDEFLGVVSHDLRNMLANVMGFATLIERAKLQGEHADAVRMHAQRIQRSGSQMSRLIGDLVDVASIEAGALAVACELGSPGDVVVEAVDAFQTQAAAYEVALLAEVIPPQSPVPFDAARIFQVLANLLSNAIKFTPAKGRVVVRVERVDDELRFGVSDNGEGIAADQLHAIFERFHQLDPNDRRGVGLGLYVSQCIVHGHGGRIWAESKLGLGSTFYFTLPIPRTPE